MNRLLILITAAALSVSAGSYAQETSKNEEPDMFALMDMLDQMDDMDFQEEIEKANDCISARRYSCAHRHIKNAKQFVNDEYQEEQLRLANEYLLDEKKAEQKELALAKRREEERKREARLQREREIARRRAEERRRQEEADTEFRRQLVTSLVSGMQEVAETNARITEENNRLIQQAYEMKRQQNRAEEERRREAAYQAEQEARRAKERREAAYAAQRRAQEAKQRQYEAKKREQERARKLAQQRAEQARKQKSARIAREQEKLRKQRDTKAEASGPVGLAIVWQLKNGNWRGHGPTQMTLIGDDKQATLSAIAGAPTEYLTTLSITVNRKLRKCEVYRVDKVVDTTLKTSWTQNIRFKYPELKKLKDMGLD